VAGSRKGRKRERVAMWLLVMVIERYKTASQSAHTHTKRRTLTIGAGSTHMLRRLFLSGAAILGLANSVLHSAISTVSSSRTRHSVRLTDRAPCGVSSEAADLVDFAAAAVAGEEVGQALTEVREAADVEGGASYLCPGRTLWTVT
jgi:hypothetical protein